MSPASHPEPIINQTIRACVAESLALGLPPDAVRASTITKFVDSFKESSAANDFVRDYQRQVTAVVDAAIEQWRAESP